ncbi:MAG: hypothetical protein EON59_14915 [Alphaproteobacteria bacterium]|nr:MAG: hypothetical protein EON59_14915 [Alphaproteobacteria bacterium]
MAIALEFGWWVSDGFPAMATCNRLSNDSDAVDVLSCILMDTGGLPLDFTLEWLSEGIALIDSVQRGSLASAEWDREDFGASISAKVTELSSLYVETYSETIDTNAFRRAIVAWREFISTDPSEHVVLRVNV